MKINDITSLDTPKLWFEDNILENTTNYATSWHIDPGRFNAEFTGALQ